MQLFITNEDPEKSAKYLSRDRVRLNKQILEATQLINNAFIFYGVPDNCRPLTKKNELYKITHKHHPISNWLYSNERNLYWLWLFLIFLFKQYDKYHFCYFSIDRIRNGIMWLIRNSLNSNWSLNFSDIEFCNCTPYKNLPVFVAYKKYLDDKWKI